MANIPPKTEIVRKHCVFALEPHVHKWVQSNKANNSDMNESLSMPYNVLQWEAQQKSAMVRTNRDNCNNDCKAPRRGHTLRVVPIVASTPLRMRALREKNNHINSDTKQLMCRFQYWQTTRPYCCVVLEDCIYQAFLRSRRHEEHLNKSISTLVSRQSSTTTTYKEYFYCSLKQLHLPKFIKYLNSLKYITLSRKDRLVDYLEPDVADADTEVAAVAEVDAVAEATMPTTMPTTAHSKHLSSNYSKLDVLCNAIQYIETI